MAKPTTANVIVPGSVPAPVSAADPGIFDRLERWIAAHLGGIVLALILSLFAYHVNRAASVHLNPDEALFYQLAHQHTIREAYLANNTNAHPPLMVLLLRSWLNVNKSEVFLRLLPIFAYCSFLWFTFRWASLAIGPAPALAATVILAFLPPLFNLAVEVRPYTMLLCWFAATLWAMERAFRAKDFPEQSAKWTGASAVFLYLAMLSHYSALWFVAAFGVYCLIRILGRGLPAAAVKVWIVGQTVAVGIYAVLYVTHISHMRNSAMEKEAETGWLRQFYRQRGDDVFHYVTANTRGLFEYLFASPWAGLIAGILVLASVAVLLRRNRTLLAVTLLPWFLYLATALTGLYPYGGTRHGAFLIFSLAIACAVALAALVGNRLWILSALLLILIPLWRAIAVPEVQVLPTERQKRELMVDAVKYLRTVVRPGGLVFADYQSALLLCYYYDPQKFCINEGGHFWVFDLGGIRLVTSQIWSLNPVQFQEELSELKKQYAVNPAAEIWSFEGGWGFPLYRILQDRRAPLPGVRGFGENIGVFRVPN